MEIDAQEYARFQKDSAVLAVFFIVLLIVPIPLAEWLGWLGLAVYLCFFGIGMYFALRVEKYKKKYDFSLNRLWGLAILHKFEYICW